MNLFSSCRTPAAAAPKAVTVECYFHTTLVHQVLRHLKTHDDARFVACCESEVAIHPPHFLLCLEVPRYGPIEVAVFVPREIPIFHLVQYANKQLPHLVATASTPTHQSMEEEVEEKDQELIVDPIQSQNN